MTIIYADLTFLLNTVLNGLALLCTFRLSGLSVRWLALLAASALGGVYSVFAAIPIYDIFRVFFAKCMVSFLMVRIAFGKDGWILRRYCLFLLVSCGLSGACEAVRSVFHTAKNPWLIFLIAIAFCAGTMLIVFRRIAVPQETASLQEATILHNGRKVTVSLLRDTGNTLRDPVHGYLVCIVWRNVLTPLGEITYSKIPFQSIGKQNGELDYFYCDQFVIGNRIWYDYPIGAASDPISDGGGYNGLWNEE